MVVVLDIFVFAVWLYQLIHCWNIVKERLLVLGVELLAGDVQRVVALEAVAILGIRILNAVIYVGTSSLPSLGWIVIRVRTVGRHLLLNLSIADLHGSDSFMPIFEEDGVVLGQVLVPRRLVES